MPKKLIQLLILLNLCFLLIACNSNSPKKAVLGCGKIQGSFIGEPFDYYERGVSFAIFFLPYINQCVNFRLLNNKLRGLLYFVNLIGCLFIMLCVL